ncbi:glycosyltransferase [Mucilaginibacter sp. 14171R-50]|uniref:glycosyltransferase n=1 Tax=Mucilaginibacter sp. 14171R-50 TaxID=2703789 RepID=UPI001EE49FAF|nr:glycosyltransferase [Mucilaginibacter sp. 14171R-50]
MLIISPYFPPVNAADMQRVRMSLPYFAAFGWDAEVVTVDERYVDMAKDDLLLQSVPQEIKIHKVKALKKKWTSKLGLGSIALRSLWFYRKKVDQLLKTSRFDLIYFSTTQFPVCILGPHWKKRFGIPYVIDMQDPWHSDYYRDKPAAQRPPKYWFSYRLNKYLEPMAIKHADGLISVSDAYISTLKGRYPSIRYLPAETITFGAFDKDLDIARDHQHKFSNLLQDGCINIVYAGRGGADMHEAIAPVFKVLRQGVGKNPELYGKLRLYFIGTSYASAGKGKATIMPLAEQYDVQSQVVEITDRISYYHTLATLQSADGLFIPGSDDPHYTASKIYPYLLTQKPLLAIFNPFSPAITVLREYGVHNVYDYQNIRDEDIDGFFLNLIGHQPLLQHYNTNAIKKYSAEQMTLNQCRVFDSVISKHLT